MKTKQMKNYMFFFIFALLIISDSSFLILKKIDSYFEYLAHLLLTVGIMYTFKNSKYTELKNKSRKDFFICLLLFSIGIIVNQLEMLSKIRLVLTMVALCSYIFLSSNYLSDYNSIKYSAYGILFGIFITTMLALLGGVSLFSKLNDSSYTMGLDVGFTGGIEFKNCFGGAVVVAFIGLFIYFMNVKETKIDLFAMYILVGLLLMSGSRGAYILFICFFVFYFYFNSFNRKGRSLSKGLKRLLFVIMLVIFILIVNIIITRVLANSATYGFRIRGVVNYIDYIKRDLFHLIFGYSEIAFKKGNDYVQNIRHFLYTKGYDGYQGSYEMGFINTLIKNGLCGIASFVIIFVYYFKNIEKMNNRKIRSMAKAVVFMLLVSSLVESYVCNIHAIFGIYCYILLSGLMSVEKTSLDTKTDEDT